MKKFNDFLKENNIKPIRYLKKGKVYIIESHDSKFVIKETNKKNLLYEYLNSRSFNYYPNIIKEDQDYTIMEYQEDIEIPKEQKLHDLIDLVSLLHNKTTFYKEVSEDEFKQIYEDIKGNIEYLLDYYNLICDDIETHVYMRPSEYLLIRNITKIYECLNFCNIWIEKWYQLIKDNKKQRYVFLHNNLDLTHFIENENNYLISWDKSKIGLPIFDLYKVYKRHYFDFEFSELLEDYESNYPLKEEERLLFFILILLPEKLILEGNEYERCKLISNELDRICKCQNLVFPKYNDTTYNNNDDEKSKVV